MKLTFDLDGKIIFSKELSEDAKNAVEEILKNADSIFLKGVPKGKEDEASKIVSHKFEGNTLKLKIVSGTYTRSHEGLIRLKKPLAQKLGREYRIGVRGIEIANYTITIETDKAKKLEGIKVPECEAKVEDSKIKTKDLGFMPQHDMLRVGGPVVPL